jgi:hypothetical protein
MTPTEYVNAHSPCEEGAQFLRQFPSVADAWDACTRSDWLMWALQRLPAGTVTDAQLRTIASRCVRETPLADERSRRAVEVEEAYIAGGATADELEAAMEAAMAAAIGAAIGAAIDAAMEAAMEAARAAQCRIVREVVGNPFRNR